MSSPSFVVWTFAAVALHVGVAATAVSLHASAPVSERAGITPQEAIIEVPAPDVERVEKPEISPPDLAHLTHQEMHDLHIPHSHSAAPAPPGHVHDHDDHDHDHDATATGTPASEAPAVAMAAPEAAPVHFSMSLGAAAISTGGPVSATPANAPSSAAVETVPESAVTESAKLVQDVKPAYPAEARSEGIEVDVPLEIVVDTNGAVVDARVTRHVGYGFDESALSAARRWRFSPAQREGHLVRVRMRWPVQFRLQ